MLILLAAVGVEYLAHYLAPERNVVGDDTDLVVAWIAAAVAAVWAGLMIWRVVGRRRRSAALRQPSIITSTGEIVWARGRYRLRDAPSGLTLSRYDQTLPEPGQYWLYWVRAPHPTLLSAELHQTPAEETPHVPAPRNAHRPR